MERSRRQTLLSGKESGPGHGPPAACLPCLPTDTQHPPRTETESLFPAAGAKVHPPGRQARGQAGLRRRGAPRPVIGPPGRSPLQSPGPPPAPRESKWTRSAPPSEPHTHFSSLQSTSGSTTRVMGSPGSETLTQTFPPMRGRTCTYVHTCVLGTHDKRKFSKLSGAVCSTDFQPGTSSHTCILCINTSVETLCLYVLTSIVTSSGRVNHEPGKSGTWGGVTMKF